MGGLDMAVSRGVVYASTFFDACYETLANNRQRINFLRYASRMTAPPLVQCCAPLAEPGLSDDEAKELEAVFKALADRHRVKILNRLLAAGGEAVCVCDFEEMLDLKQPTVSYHLKQLLDAGIVEREKRGSFAYFSIAEGALEHVCGLLGYECS
jgi:ArsR family transcriptional regulator